MSRHLPSGLGFANYRGCVGFMEKAGGVSEKALLKFDWRTDRFDLPKSIGMKPPGLERKSLKSSVIWINEPW